jgi:hypothetical protein
MAASPSTGVQLVEEVEDAVPSHEDRVDDNPPTDQPVVDDEAAEALGLKAPPKPSPQPKQSDGQFKHHGAPPAEHGGGSHHHH